MNEYMILFSEYLRPDGRKRPIMFPCDEKLYDRASDLIDKGLSFTCEVLSTGEAAFYVGTNDGDVATEISDNGPAVKQAVERLISNAEKAVKNES